MATLIAEFSVIGKAVPQGSTRAFAIRKGKGKDAPIVGVGNTNDPTGTIARWRGDVRRAAQDAELHHVEVDGPISMRLVFRVARPQSHFLPVTKSRPAPELRLDAPAYPTGKPDVDKLGRAVMDALTGVTYTDDAQVASLGSVKRYADPGEQPGVDVRVSAL